MSTAKYTTALDPETGLLRITAARDVRPGVPAGTVGGLIASEANLSHEGECWVYGSARVSGSAQVYDSAWVSGSAQVYDSARVSGSARVYDSARVSETRHVLVVHPTASENVVTTATRQRDGTMRVRVGCWDGTTDDLRALARSDSWPSGCDETTRALHRPSLLALADLCDAHAATWAEVDR